MVRAKCLENFSPMTFTDESVFEYRSHSDQRHYLKYITFRRSEYFFRHDNPSHLKFLLNYNYFKLTLLSYLFCKGHDDQSRLYLCQYLICHRHTT